MTFFNVIDSLREVLVVGLSLHYLGVILAKWAFFFLDLKIVSIVCLFSFDFVVHG